VAAALFPQALAIELAKAEEAALAVAEEEAVPEADPVQPSLPLTWTATEDMERAMAYEIDCR